MMQAIQADPGAISNYATAGQLMDQLGQTGMKVFANGQQVNFATYGAQPVIKDGRTMLPVRAMMSALNAQVSWNPSTQTVTVTAPNGTTIQMTIGSNQMIVNGQTVTTDVAPYIDNGRMMLPLRAMAEALGMNVDWLAQSDMVVMTSGQAGNSVSDSVYEGVYTNVYGE
ncbi:MAG: copper amine oxidase N-terminal domain-containing protein [Peptococcaceae bacterium]|nr:copper amine oxidase N-terminal domain-containing protein [Peptococcaceae bacterium]